MKNYTINITGEWERDTLSIKGNFDEDTLREIMAYILRKLAASKSKGQDNDKRD